MKSVYLLEKWDIEEAIKAYVRNDIDAKDEDDSDYVYNIRFIPDMKDGRIIGYTSALVERTSIY